MTKIHLKDVLKYKQRRKSHSDYDYGGWYLIENTLNGKKYIGRSIEYLFRLRQHVTFKNPKILIDKEIKKYGMSNFNFYVIDVYSSYNIDFFNRKIQGVIEQKFIKEYKTNYPYGYNIAYYE
jgi:hypothetical protein